MNLAIIAACMSTLPGVFAMAKTYRYSIYKSIRSRILTSRSSGCMDSTSRNGVTKTGSNDNGVYNKNEVYAALGTRKKIENTNYIALKYGTNNGANIDGLSNSDRLPFWGRF